MKNIITTQEPENLIAAHGGFCQTASAVDAQENARVTDVDSIISMVNVLIEEERKHIAREMHDELGQILTALGLHLALVRKRFGSQLPGADDDLEHMKMLIERAIGGVRQVTSQLRPPALDKGLLPAIECLCREFTELTGVDCQLHAPDDTLGLDTMRMLTVFRIVQESLTNVTRYANASRVDVGIWRRGNELHVQVRDNGCGFDPQASWQGKKSFGMLGMRERATVFGGRVDVQSHPGQGTVIELALPFGLEPEISIQ